MAIIIEIIKIVDFGSSDEKILAFESNEM